MVKDISGMNKAKIKKDKKIIDNKGTIRIVPFNQWKKEVINNPKGRTAQLAKLNKDKDLDNLSVDVIQINHSITPEVYRVTQPKTNTVKVEAGKNIQVKPTIGKETANRLGYRNSEDGKGSK